LATLSSSLLRSSFSRLISSSCFFLAASKSGDALAGGEAAATASTSTSCEKGQAEPFMHPPCVKK